eukprot:PITA_09995
MEDLLVDKDKWNVVDPGTKPMGVSNEEWKKLDQKEKSTIRLCVLDSVLLNVSGEATMKALWDKLGTLYQSKSLVNKLFLQKKLYNLRLKDGDSVTEHLNAFNTVFNEIVSSLLMEEMRRKHMESQNGDALFVQGWSQNRNKNKSSSGRSKSRGRSKSPGKPGKVVCWKCEKEGHYKRDYKSKATDKGKGSDDAPSTEVKTTSDEGGDVYLASSNTHVDHEAWFIDSGASFHFTPHKEWFCEYEKYVGGDIFFGDDRAGKVKLKLQVGRVRTLSGVLHIPTLARNLIFVRKLDDVGVKTVFEKDTCKMVQGALVLMSRVPIEIVYKLQGSTIVDGWNSYLIPKSGVENLVVSGENTILWHQRLGHIGENGLQILHGKGMVEGISNSSLDFDFCENCVYGKQNRVSFPSSGKREKQILELVHSDVFRPVKVPSLGLGQEFWAEVMETTCYLVNRSPSSMLEDKTPQEIWTNNKPSLSHLKVFGCDAYVHAPKEK